MKINIKLILISMFIYQFGWSQDFCNFYFGEDWVTLFNLPLKPSEFFGHDTIIFKRDMTENIDHEFISLNCKDSTFHFVYCYKLDYNNSTDVWINSYSTDSNGKWKFDSVNDIITFRLNKTDKIYTFKVLSVGTKETNKRYIWRSDGDYRTELHLIKI